MPRVQSFVLVIKMFPKSIILLTFISGMSINAYPRESIKVSILYDAGTTDMKDFILTQLQPTYKALSDRITLELIPCGYTEHQAQSNVNDEPNFKCQCDTATNLNESLIPRSGGVCCAANVLHACAVHSVHDTGVQLAFLGCAVSTPKPTSAAAIEHCASVAGMNAAELINCVKGAEGAQLLAHNGLQQSIMTFAPSVRLPAVAFNGFVNDASRTRTHLLATTCAYLSDPPSECDA